MERVSYGMDDADDILMRSWTGTIIGPHNTVHEGQIYQLKIFCDKDYPNNPTTVRFQSRINMTCVNQETEMVGPSLFPNAFELAERAHNGRYINQFEDRNGLSPKQKFVPVSRRWQ